MFAAKSSLSGRRKFSLLPCFFDGSYPQPQEEIRDDHHEGAQHEQIAVAEQLAAPNRPQNEQRRQTAEHHKQPGRPQSFAVLRV